MTKWIHLTPGIQLNRLAIAFDKFTDVLFYYFFLGGPLLTVLVSLFFLNYHLRDLTIWFVSHFVMVTGLSVCYHRYFSHKTFEANRFVQFLLGFWGTLCLQRGPMWWSSIHRMHHRFCGTKDDPHTPSKGFSHSHVFWLHENKKIQWKYVQDLQKYPELYVLEYLYLVNIPAISFICWYYGGLTAVFAYQAAITTSVNSIAAVNSFCHERNEKSCQPLNVKWVAVLGAGEGFHANHHDHPGSASFSAKWYQIDISFLLIQIMQFLRIVKNVRVTKKTDDLDHDSTQITNH